MKITKRQLRRIIREEKAKIRRKQLNESVTDMRKYEDMIENFTFEVTEMFRRDMESMIEEDPEAFSQTPQEWDKEVMSATNVLDREVSLAIAKAIQAVEAELINGGFGA